MKNLLKNELAKAIKLKPLYLGILFCLVFAFLVLWDGNKTTFEMGVSAIKNLSKSYVIVLTIGMISFLWGVESQSKTLKIIRSKALPGWKFISAKYAIGILYAFLQILFCFIMVMTLAYLFAQTSDFPDLNGGVISASQGFSHVLKMYLFQFLATVFIVSLILFFAILFNNSAVALVLSFFSVILSVLASNIKILAPFLPTTYFQVWEKMHSQDIVWNDVGINLIILFLYSFGFYVASVYFFNRRDVLL